MKTLGSNLLKYVCKTIAFCVGLFAVGCFFAAFVEGMTPGRSSQASSFLLSMLVGGFCSAMLFMISEEV